MKKLYLPFIYREDIGICFLRDFLAYETKEEALQAIFAEEKEFNKSSDSNNKYTHCSIIELFPICEELKVRSN